MDISDVEEYQRSLCKRIHVTNAMGDALRGNFCSALSPEGCAGRRRVQP